MNMKRSLLVIVIVTAVTAPLSVSGSEDDGILGTWLVEEKTGKIKIFRCGDKFCGKTLWIKPSAEQPEPEKGLDIHNPDPKKRSRKIVGMTMLWGLRYNREARRWEDGHIYDNRSGKVYRCQVTLETGGRKLLLRGFVGFALIGQTTTWTRLK